MGDRQPSDTTREYDPRVDPLLFTVKANPGDPPVEGSPATIGRYEVDRLLGRGGFGVVYLASDRLLNRQVAIKIPHRRIVDEADDATIYLNEARAVAALDHPHIVSVYDVGSTPEFPFFLVSKYIDGTDLASRIRQAPFSIRDAVQLAETVAEALHYAHQRGLVHRDIKPGNLLLDQSGRPYVADFGLALRDDQFGTEPDQICGTSHYMSPEQARGESHLVDGRADIFSLGVVLYELLTGFRPFPGTTFEEVIRSVIVHEPRPLRQRNEHIPRELDRIVMQALSKRSSDRYSTAKDFAADLQHFLQENDPDHGSHPARVLPAEAPSKTLSRDSAAQYSGSKSLVVVPKGLQAFDEADGEFFLGLVPGPHDRDGLPRCLKFWKTRITSTAHPLRIGVVYGPSGSGKSSLIRAGLLPRLPESVHAVVVTATAQSTERQLIDELNGLLPEPLPRLPEILKRLRQRSSSNRQVLIVIDQFEQWLHGHRGAVDSELVQALRQCDGQHVSCLLIVRDDFWMSVHRFFGELDIRLAEQENCAAVDLFDTRHARRVLQAFGHAYGALPERLQDFSADQNRFLDRVIEELSEADRVICVRLALFAQMVCNRPWIPDTLAAVGGARGVGIRFLEETFGSSTAPLSYRVHGTALSSILKSLLPPPGTEIKACTRSAEELAQVARCDVASGTFAQLLGILETETRLVTPVDGLSAESSHSGAKGPPVCGYQLTHDYLVPSIREWLGRKQRNSWRGRCELKLEERAVFWNARPELRQLPSCWETAQITLGTNSAEWSPIQTQMMRMAQRWHGGRVLLLGIVLAGGLLAGTIWHRNAQQVLRQRSANEHVDRLMVADTGHIVPILKDMESTRDVWTDRMRKLAFRSSSSHAEKLRADLALVPQDRDRIPDVLQLALACDVETVGLVRGWLARYAAPSTSQLWSVEQLSRQPAEAQLRSAAILATLAPDVAEYWNVLAAPVAKLLVREVSLDAGSWMDLLQPVRARLASEFADLLIQGLTTSGQRITAAELLAQSGNPDLLCRILPDLNAAEFSIIIRPLLRDPESSIPRLRLVLDTVVATNEIEKRLQLVRRQRTAGVALMLLGREDLVWPLLSGTADLSLRTELMLTMRAYGVPFETLLSGEQVVTEAFARQAIWQSFAADESEMPAQERAELARRIPVRWSTAQNQSERSGIMWLAQRSGLSELIEQTEQTMPAPTANWITNSQGQTFLKVTGPVEFEMGSLPHDPRRDRNERLHRRRIERSFAISTLEVTVAEFRRFRPDYQPDRQVAPTDDCPAISISWLEAARYCRWLSLQEQVPEDQICYPDQDQINLRLEFPQEMLSRTGYRLPTEAEWEYVCRSDSDCRYQYGEDEQYASEFGWWLGNSRERTWEVGMKRPNRFGLFDMQGNVLEWCQDALEDYLPEHVQSPVRNPPAELRGLAGTERVLRGGNYRTANRSFRNAHRMGYGAQVDYSTLGFRLARTLPVQ